MKIQPKACSLADFPTSSIAARGVKVLRADESKRSVTTILGVEYARKSGMPLHVHILMPRLEEGEEATFPLVLFVQGSAWFKQEVAQQMAQLVHIAERGFVIAMAEYRPSTVAPFPAQIKDARTASRFMLRHAAEYHADPKRLIVWGDSSGGHTVTMLAVTNGDPHFSDEDAPPLPIRGVVDYYGPANLGTMNDEPSTQDHDAPDSPEGMVLGGIRVSEHPALVSAASPLTYITAASRLPPFLIMHGDKDRLVPYGQSVLLYEKLTECNQKAELYRIAGADHSGNAFWTAEEPLRITEAFMASCCAAEAD
jgi:acetyl esterase/lipase